MTKTETPPPISDVMADLFAAQLDEAVDQDPRAVSIASVDRFVDVPPIPDDLVDELVSRQIGETVCQNAGASLADDPSPQQDQAEKSSAR
jgi:hypothetical protein